MISNVLCLGAIVALACFGLSPAAAVTLAADFTIPGSNPSADVFLGYDYTEGGLRFQTSPPTPVQLQYSLGGMHAGNNIVGAPRLARGRVLSFDSLGWFSISAPGYVMNSLSFIMGNAWGVFPGIPVGYEVTDQYQMLLNGVVVGSGLFNGTRSSLGQDGMGEFQGVFDQLLVKSTARQYNIRFGTWTDYGDASQMIIDNVVVQATPTTTVANVPDAGSAGTLLLIASFGLLAMTAVHRRARA